jgi:S1-C subfamily serine protease
MKTKQKITSIIILVSIIIISIFLPSMKSFYHQAMNREFMEKVESKALSANIQIVQLKYRNEESGNSMAVSAGASGVIFRKEGNKYYALTANHVVAELEDVDKTQIIVMGYDDLDFKDYLNSGGTYIGIENYYKQFSVGTVEYSNVKYDLALISFTSDKNYTALSLAERTPKYGDKVATISNPYGKRNIVTAGKIGNKKFWTYEDEAGKIKYPIVKHSALITAGSSGSALLSEDLEIVGINLGGNENIFHQFISGMAMQNEQIHDFLEEWEK